MNSTHLQRTSEHKWANRLARELPVRRSRPEGTDTCACGKTVTSLYQRLSDEAQRLRKEAIGTPPGVGRELLICRARRAEAASRTTEWLTSTAALNLLWEKSTNRSALAAREQKDKRKA